jgi:hypothetical protein
MAGGNRTTDNRNEMEALPNKVKDLSMEMHEMHTAIEELAEHIVEPVAAKLSTEELGRILSRINYAFQQLNIKHIPGDTNFENIAFTIFRPIQPVLGEGEFTRMVDRLKGAMVGFCQSGWTDQDAG